MKIAVRRTYFGDRLCFPGLVPHALLDVRAAYARMLVISLGMDREDALARAERTIAADLPALLRDDPGLGEVRRVYEWAAGRVEIGDLHDGCTWLHVRKLLGPPVGAPRTVWGMTGNYPREAPQVAKADVASAAEPTGRTERAEPPEQSVAQNQRGFLKAAGALAGPYDHIRYPAISSRVDPEIELAVVIGQRCRKLERDSAMDAVAGYVILCDLGARDIGALDGRMLDRAKGFDTFALIGPWFVTADEIAEPHKLHIRAWVNGKLRQDGSTSGMLHDIPEQLEWLSSALTLRPGDVSTGTPAGVAPIVPGDVLRGEIEGLGEIESVVTNEPSAEPAEPSARTERTAL
jgi:2-keto-4-pentenoate hydratase/2-oxohepta-3-ene-1,7-dioic acid hydratase in catechol pathway